MSDNPAVSTRADITPWRAFPARPEDWFSPEEVDKAKRYAKPLKLAGIARSVLSLAAMAALLRSHVLVDLTDGMPWVAGLFAVVAVVTLVEAVVGLPFSVWRTLSYDKRWGFSTTSTRTFVTDELKGIALGIVITGVVFLPLWALLRSTSWWWLWGAGVFVLVNVLFAVIFPVAIAPLFNKYTPMEGELRDRLLGVARSVDADVSEVLVEDASKRDTRKNAYVAGLGATRRVVVFDTMLEWSPAEIEAVVAHELGHWKLRHIRRTIPAIGVVGLVTFALLGLVLDAEPLLDFAGVADVGDPAALPLLMLLFSLLTVVTGLFPAWLSRAHERQADLFGLAAIGDAEVFGSMMRKLHTETLADLAPSAWRRLRASHPPAAQRLAMAAAWGRGAAQGRSAPAAD